MLGGMGIPIPYLSNLPGPSRPGGGGVVVDTYGFKFAVGAASGTDRVAIEVDNQNSGSFTITWQDGTNDVVTILAPTVFTSPTANAGTISINKVTDTDFCSKFKITSQQELVTRVIEWGENFWRDLTDGFKDCTNLTSFPSIGFVGSSLTNGVDLESCFEGCSSLTALDLSGWDITGGSIMIELFKGCVLANNVSLPALTPMTGSWTSCFEGIGIGVTNGCSFNLQALDFTGSIDNYSFNSMFKYSRINPLSNFTNWVFGGTEISNSADMFRETAITGLNPVLNVSGWSDFTTKTLTSMFFGINAGAAMPAASEITIEEYTLNISNLNTSSSTSFSNTFGNPNAESELGLKSIIGLSTLLTSSSVVTIGSIMVNQRNLAIPVGDNFSDDFMDNLALAGTGFAAPFLNLGSLLTTAYGAAPNLSALDLSEFAGITNSFRNGKYSTNLDFSQVVFKPLGTAFYYAFNNIKFSNTDSHLEFPNAMKLAGAFAMQNAFENAVVRKITFSNNVDFSDCESFQFAFRNLVGSENADPTLIQTTDINLPTNMSFESATSSSGAFNSFLNNVKGPGSTGAVASNWNALSSCQTNNLLRNLKTSLPTPGADADIDLRNCKYSGPQALVSDDYATLIANGWSFTTLASEDPYFSIPSYVSPGGTTQNITFASGIANDGVWSVTNGVATVDNSTPASTTITAAVNGNGIVRYTRTDGCYNEVNFVATIPLIANNFSFNFDGINDFLSVDVQSNFTYGTGDFTISSWVFPERINDSYEMIWSQGGSTNAGTSYMSLNNNTLAFYDGDSTQILSPAGSIKANEWQQVAIRRSSGTTQLFINGIASGSSSTSQSGNFIQPSIVNIGRWSFAGPPRHYFDGKMDELFIYNTALTGSQILDIYNGRLGVTNETVDLSKYDGLGGNLVYWNRMGD
tara:strand:+ start:472 stop:3225 length:2754 start_codon:yes stop_codon:yes gene_type:complete